MDPMTPAMMWWINVIEVPIVGALFLMINGLRKDVEARLESKDSRQSDGLTRTREDLAAFKLEVARTYVPLTLIRDVDRRMSEQLLRIEEKLEEMRREGERR